jgi:hypothetical protein
VNLEIGEVMMSKPHASEMSQSREGGPSLAWDEATAYAMAARLPQERPERPRSKLIRFMLSPVVGTLGMLAVAAAARSTSLTDATECRISEPPLVFGANSETQMLVRGGLPCPIWTHIASAGVNELAIVVAPKHGTAASRRSGVIYRPTAAFHGSDVFEFTVRRQSTATVRVKATAK